MYTHADYCNGKQTAVHEPCTNFEEITSDVALAIEVRLLKPERYMCKVCQQRDGIARRLEEVVSQNENSYSPIIGVVCLGLLMGIFTTWFLARRFRQRDPKRVYDVESQAWMHVPAEH